MSTLRILVRRAYDIFRQMNTYKMNYIALKRFFTEENQCRFWTIKKVFCEIKRSNHKQLQEQRQQQLPTNSSHKEVLNSKTISCFYRITRKGLII